MDFQERPKNWNTLFVAQNNAVYCGSRLFLYKGYPLCEFVWGALLKQTPMQKIEFQDLDMFLRSEKSGPTKWNHMR